MAATAPIYLAISPPSGHQTTTLVIDGPISAVPSITIRVYGVHCMVAFGKYDILSILCIIREWTIRPATVYAPANLAAVASRDNTNRYVSMCYVSYVLQ